MSDIVVERGIPLPASSRGVSRAGSGHHRTKYPWDSMGVGDSFLAPADVSWKSIRSNISIRSYRGAGEYATRKVEVDGVKRIRVWRTA